MSPALSTNQLRILEILRKHPNGLTTGGVEEIVSLLRHDVLRILMALEKRDLVYQNREDCLWYPTDSSGVFF